MFDRISVKLVVDGRDVDLKNTGRYKIHRGVEKKVVLEGPGYSRPEVLGVSKAVSKYGHLEVHVKRTGVRLVDVGSSRGSYIDGEKDPFRDITLKSLGDYNVRLGDGFNVEFVLEK